ncbi:hypothetical protein HELRODRAFT_162957 [Helobdella robusta]|uniref:Uncharacterized protein n=1 Tax=Helobdella robusta TaxID=6412 RepID=T1ETF3_HELRO|nr:hypothetical protein HELRODRAFT_162957 [Helobdella robusta]ESN99410.1 hypothetical protein HELRODRAFT_162957 [Helobdella robusta]
MMRSRSSITLKYEIVFRNTEDLNKSKYEIFRDSQNKQRKKVKGCNPDNYKKLDKTILKMCLEAKDKCEIIEKIKNINTNARYENIKEITGKGLVPYQDASIGDTMSTFIHF